VFKELKRGVQNVFIKKPNLANKVANKRTLGPKLVPMNSNAGNGYNVVNGEVFIPKLAKPESTMTVAEPMVVMAAARRNHKTRRSHRMRR